MGGDHLNSFASEDESSTLEHDDDFSEFSSYPSSFYRDGLGMRNEEESSRGSSGYVYKGFDEVGHMSHSNPVEFDNNLRRRKISYNEIMRNYDELWARRECLYQAKNKILSYNPGAWISNAGNKKLQDYALPKTTSLLLVGPKGSGKSSLVNRISRVFENDKFASERAQVTYNSNSGEGTFFLQEYMIPRGSSSFCLFDTRSLSEDSADNDESLQLWMIKGVRHGELVARDSDSPRLRMSLKCKAQQSGTPSSEIRKINFVVYVVNALSVLRSMNSHQEEDRRYMELVMNTFSCPYLSFKDDKPVIVVTHGDLLSLGDRARVRVYLGEKLGVPPAKQIFDIPDNSDPLTELTIVDMVRYSLEHADKHMPCRESREWMNMSRFSIDRVKHEVSVSSVLSLMFLAMLLGTACVAFPFHRSHKHSASLQESATSRISYPHEFHATFPSYSESKPPINYSQNQKPQPMSPQTSPSKSVVDIQGHENKEPEPIIVQTQERENLNAKHEDRKSKAAILQTREPENPEAEHENHEPEAIILRTQEQENPEAKLQNQEHEIASNFPSKIISEDQEQENWEAEHDSTSQLLQPAKSSLTLPLKRDGKHKSRSPSPEKRHPKSAVKWHKIRHLWLDD